MILFFIVLKKEKDTGERGLAVGIAEIFGKSGKEKPWQTVCVDHLPGRRVREAGIWGGYFVEMPAFLSRA